MARTTLGARALLRARKRIRAHLAKSPLIHSKSLSERIEGEVWLKLECRQPTGSFKVRGALNKLSLQQSNESGFVTGSAGNHGLGLAFAAEALAIEQVTIFVPETAPKAKLNRLKQFAISLRVAGKTYDHAHQAALEYAGEHGLYYVHAYDDDDVIAGQGTVGLEIMEDLPEADCVIVPVGGGGLIAGIAIASKELSPSVDIVGAQAKASPSAFLSFRDGLPYDPFDHEQTIADGLAGGFGARPFYLARSLIERIELFSEDAMRRSIFTLLDDDHVLAEASGAVAIAPLLDGNEWYRDKKVVCVISGGNLETKLLKDVLNEHS